MAVGPTNGGASEAEMPLYFFHLVEGSDCSQNICVFATILGAVEHGYLVILDSDAVCSA